MVVDTDPPVYFMGVDPADGASRGAVAGGDLPLVQIEHILAAKVTLPSGTYVCTSVPVSSGGVGLEFRRLSDMTPVKLADPAEEAAVIRAIVLHDLGASLTDMTKIASALKEIQKELPTFSLPGYRGPQ